MVNQKPIVSVLMTAYNREKYIGEAIESVLASIFQDFELIIVDDCSLDKTVDIAKSYEAKDSRIKVYINESNLGDYPNRNKAASYAKGKYLKYLDSDDAMSNNCLKVMVGEMEKHPDCAFGISSRSLTNVTVHYPNTAYRTHFFERGILDLSPSLTIIKKDIFENEKGFLELRCVSDTEFFMRIALKYPLLEMQMNLVNWRQHPDQEIIKGKDEYLMYSLNLLIEKLNLSSLRKKDQIKIINREKKSLVRNLIKNIFNRKFKNTLNYWKTNNLSLLNIV